MNTNMEKGEKCYGRETKCPLSLKKNRTENPSRGRPNVFNAVEIHTLKQALKRSDKTTVQTPADTYCVSL